jgi:hypothetical protein
MTARHGRRISSFLSLLLFLLGTSGTALLRHPCPHHDAGLVGGATAAGQHGHHDSAPAEQKHGGCSCVGDCLQNSGVGVPVAAAVAPADAPVARTAKTYDARTRTHVQPRYFLPFANAPPVIA